MKFKSIVAPFDGLLFVLRFGLWPTLRAIWKMPSLVFNPFKFRRTLFSNAWKDMGDFVDEASGPHKGPLIKEAQGIVLDMGAGHGHTVNHLDAEKVWTYIALEPNTLMHPSIRERAAAIGYIESAYIPNEDTQPSQKKLIILPYGVEEIANITTMLNSYGISQVDAVISIFTCCSIPSPEIHLPTLLQTILKKDGLFLYYEHVLSPDADVAKWQRIWTPLWKRFFDGCCMDVPTDRITESITASEPAGGEFWKEGKVWDMDENTEEDIGYIRIGRYVKGV